MKGRWLAGVLACAMILLAAAAAPAKEKTTGRSAHAWLGVQLQNPTRDVSRTMNLRTDRGALIAEVLDGSPADRAGLRDGDVVTGFNGRTVRNAADLTGMIQRAEPGSEVPITIVRNGGELRLSVRLGDLSDRYPNRYGTEQTGAGAGNPPGAFLGVQLEGLTDQLGDYFGVEDGEGALIASVVDGSPAERAGLKAGDVITRINDRDVTSPADVTRVVRRMNPGDSVDITYLSDQGHSKNTVTADLARPRPGQMMDRDMNMGPGMGGMMGSGMMGSRMQNMHDWNQHQTGTYGSGMSTSADHDMQQQFEQLHNQIRDLQRQIQDMREELQAQRNR
jgi:C-terminal processing protease CtpA/Prc